MSAHLSSLPISLAPPSNQSLPAGADEEQQLAQRLRGVELPEHHELVERSRCSCRVVFLTELSHCAIHDMDDDAQSFAASPAAPNSDTKPFSQHQQRQCHAGVAPNAVGLADG
uniref:Uncharacterized protein n=1 Tax=Oryza sativa subsp. japonica TaxID=39947 RepID=Q5Z7F1_ORYSJ|nr:hypothetical protein [Oryza sativa Japonica Group]